MAQSHVSTPGVIFEALSINDAMAKAEAANKLVFVDCYTSWCGPCKKMTDEVFPRAEVGEYFAPRFIAVKYDIEKEDDGRFLAKEHGVSVIPTYLILNPDGSLLHRFSGAYDTERFLRKVEESFDDDKSYGSLKKAYETGRDNREFLEQVLKSFTSIRDPKTQEVLARLEEQLTDEEKIQPEYWFIYEIDLLNTIGSKNEQFLFDNAAKFRQNIGFSKVDPILERHYKARLMNIIGLKEEITPEAMNKMIGQVEELFPASDLEKISYIAASVREGDWDNMTTVCKEQIPAMKNWRDAFVALIDRIVEQGTIEQKRAWFELGDRLLEQTPPNNRGFMETVLRVLREKAGC